MIFNKFRILSIYALRFFKINILAKEPIDNPRCIVKKGVEVRIIPKNIWIFWDDLDNMPLLVGKCIDKITELNKDFNVHILSNENICNYIPTINQFKFPKIQHKSDYIRLYMLKEYGGVWLDASIIFYQPLDFFLEKLNENKSSFFAFSNNKRTIDIEYPIIENWLLISTKNNQFIKNWLDEYEFALKIGPKMYIDILSKKSSGIFQKIKKNEREYLFNYICAQVVLRKYKDDYVFLSCDDTAFYYHYTGSWRYMFLGLESFHYTNLIKTLTLFKKPQKNPILVKLVAGDRHHLNLILENMQYRSDSLFGDFLGIKDEC